MEAKAEKFLKNLALQHSGQNLPKKKLHEILDEAIASMPQNQLRLQKYLIKFFNKSLKKIVKYVQGNDNQILATYFRESLQEMIITENTDELEEFQETALVAFDECNGVESRMAFARRLCGIVIAKKSSDLIHSIANVLFDVFDKDVESILKKENKFASSLKVTLKNLFSILVTNYSASKKESTLVYLPGFSDVVAAVFSLIIDLTIFECRSSTDSKECIKNGKVLLETGIVFLEKHHIKLLDSILQSSASHLNNADLVLMPLYKFILLQQSWSSLNLDGETYLRCIAASMQGISLLQKRRAKISASIRNAALQIPAPDGFYKWVSLRDGTKLIEETSWLRSTNAIEVTKILITQCDDELMDKFLDLCTIDVAEEEGEVIEKKTKESHQEKPSELFVLDAKPSKPVSVESIAQSIDQIKPTFSDEESGEDNSGDELLKQTNYLLDPVPASGSDEIDVMTGNNVANQEIAPAASDFDSADGADLKTKLKKLKKKLKKKKIVGSLSDQEKQIDVSSKPGSSYLLTEKVKKTTKKAKAAQEKNDVLSESLRDKKQNLKTGGSIEAAVKSKKMKKVVCSSKTDKISLASRKPELVEEADTTEEPIKKLKLEVENKKSLKKANKHLLANANASEMPHTQLKEMPANVTSNGASLEPNRGGRKMTKAQKRQLQMSALLNDLSKTEKDDEHMDAQLLNTAKKSKKSLEKENDMPMVFETPAVTNGNNFNLGSKSKRVCESQFDSCGKREKTLTKSQRKRRMLLQALSPPEAQPSNLESECSVTKKQAKMKIEKTEAPKQSVVHLSKPNKELESSTVKVKKRKKNRDVSIGTPKQSDTRNEVNKIIIQEKVTKSVETTKSRKTPKQKLSSKALKKALLLELEQSTSTISTEERLSDRTSGMEDEEHSNQSLFHSDQICKDLSKDLADVSTTQDTLNVHHASMENSPVETNVKKDVSDLGSTLAEGQQLEKFGLGKSPKKKQRTPVKSDVTLPSSAKKSTNRRLLGDIEANLSTPEKPIPIDSLETTKSKNKKTKRKSASRSPSVSHVADVNPEIPARNNALDDALSEIRILDILPSGLQDDEELLQQSTNNSVLSSPQLQLACSHHQDQQAAASSEKTSAAKRITPASDNLEDAAANESSAVSACVSSSPKKSPVKISRSVESDPGTPEKPSNLEPEKIKSPGESKRLSKKLDEPIQSLSPDDKAINTSEDKINEVIVPDSDIEGETEQVGTLLKDRNLSYSQTYDAFDKQPLKERTGDVRNEETKDTRDENKDTSDEDKTGESHNRDIVPEVIDLSSGKSPDKSNSNAYISVEEFSLSESSVVETHEKSKQSRNKSSVVDLTSNNDDTCIIVVDAVSHDDFSEPLFCNSKTRNSAGADVLVTVDIHRPSKKAESTEVSPLKSRKRSSISPKKTAVHAKPSHALPETVDLTIAEHPATERSSTNESALIPISKASPKLTPKNLAALGESFDKNLPSSKPSTPRSKKDDEVVILSSPKLRKSPKKKNIESTDELDSVSVTSDHSEGKLVLIVSDSENEITDRISDKKALPCEQTIDISSKDEVAHKDTISSTENEMTSIVIAPSSREETPNIRTGSSEAKEITSLSEEEVISVDCLKSSISSSANSTSSFLTAKESLSDNVCDTQTTNEELTPPVQKVSEMESLQEQQQSETPKKVETRRLRSSVKKQRLEKTEQKCNSTLTALQKALKVVIEGGTLDTIVSQTAKLSDSESLQEGFDPPKRRSKRNTDLTISSQSSVVSEKEGVVSQLSPISEKDIFVPRRSTRISRGRVNVEYRTRSDSESSMDSVSSYALRRSKRLCQVSSRNPRSDSESSTASHSYGTRSRK